MVRPLVLGSLLAVTIAGVAMWWAAPTTAVDPRRTPAQARVQTRPAAPAVPHLPHATALPDAHGAESVRARLAGFAHAGVELLEPDCTEAPCLIGVRFDGHAVGGRDGFRRVLREVRADVERRLGFAMTVIHLDEDTAGRQYLWMYALPDALAHEDREVLRASAEARHARWVAGPP